MTFEEKRQAIEDYCGKRGRCLSDGDVCPLFDLHESSCYTTPDDSLIDKHYDILVKSGCIKNVELENLIHHPNHYTYRNMECIDEMVAVFGLEDAITFCKLNAWKYRYRTSEKGGEQDLQKSDRYIEMIGELRKKYGNVK